MNCQPQNRKRKNEYIRYLLINAEKEIKKNIKLSLTDFEKANLRKNKIEIADILDLASDELDLTQQPNGKKKNIS